MTAPINMLKASILIDAPLTIVWQKWTTASDIVQWNLPSADWRTVSASVDFRAGGMFFFRMEKTDGSEGIDYAGVYDYVVPHSRIDLTLNDGRRSTIIFDIHDDQCRISEYFEPTDGVPEPLQEEFCQGVLQHFRTYVEGGQ